MGQMTVIGVINGLGYMTIKGLGQGVSVRHEVKGLGFGLGLGSNVRLGFRVIV